jgi:hypothetical protein
MRRFCISGHDAPRALRRALFNPRFSAREGDATPLDQLPTGAPGIFRRIQS